MVSRQSAAAAPRPRGRLMRTRAPVRVIICVRGGGDARARVADDGPSWSGRAEPGEINAEIAHAEHVRPIILPLNF